MINFSFGNICRRTNRQTEIRTVMMRTEKKSEKEHQEVMFKTNSKSSPLH